MTDWSEGVRDQLASLVLADGDERRAITVLSWVGMGVTAALLGPLAQLSASEFCLWVTATRAEAEQLRNRLADEGVEATYFRTSLEMQEFKISLTHMRSPVPKFLVVTSSQLNGHNFKDLALALPAPKIAVLGSGVQGQRTLLSPLVEAAWGVVYLIGPSSIDTIFREPSSKRAEILVDFRPSAELVSELITLKVLKYFRSASEKALVVSLPDAYVRLVESSRGALRQRLEGLGPDESGDGVESIENLAPLGAVDAEGVLDQLDDLPPDGRIDAIAGVVRDQPGLIVMPMLRLRSIQYFGTLLKDLLGSKLVATGLDELTSETRILITGTRSLDQLQLDTSASIWAEMSTTVDGVFRRLGVLRRRPHTVYLLSPDDPTEKERQRIDGVILAMDFLPEFLGSMNLDG